MGRAKDGLPFAGGTLLQRVVSVARQAAEEVVLVGDADLAARLGLRSAADLTPGAGPLSGLAGGLALCPDGVHALLACDLPFVTPDLLHRLETLAGDAHAAVPRVDGRLHPLLAVYRRSCLEPARACVRGGRRRMDDLLERVTVRAVGPEEVRPVSLARAVTNVNTPEDYSRALEALEDGEHGP